MTDRGWIDASDWLERACAHPTTAKDPRLAALLTSARLERAEPAARAWTSSAGVMRAFRVRVWTTADALMELAAAPSLHDELTAVLSASIARDPGATLDAIELAWGRRARCAHGYREAGELDLPVHNADALREELAWTLRARGEVPLADALRAARVTLSETTLRVTGVDPSLRAALEARLAPLATRIAVR